jgi:hypothetical protein
LSSSAVAKADDLLSSTFGGQIEEYNSEFLLHSTSSDIHTSIVKGNDADPSEEKYSLFDGTVENQRNSSIEPNADMEISTETPFKASFDGHAYSPSTPFTPYAMIGGELMSGQGLHTGGSLGRIPLNRERDVEGTDIDGNIWNTDAINSSPRDISYDQRNPGNSSADNNEGSEGWLADALHNF